MAKVDSQLRSQPAGAAPEDARQLDPRIERGLDLTERAFCILLFGAMCLRLSSALAARPWDGLILAPEALMVALIVFRRRPTLVSARAIDWIAAFVGTAAPMLARPGGQAFIPPSAAAGLMVGGLLTSIWAMLTLRRSFGLTAANRGVVQSGPYSFVRHPMYVGYIFANFGFLAANPVLWNFAIYGLALVSLIYRVLAEEKVLVLDPAYAAFMGRVRYRLAPGLF